MVHIPHGFCSNFYNSVLGQIHHIRLKRLAQWYTTNGVKWGTLAQSPIYYQKHCWNVVYQWSSVKFTYVTKVFYVGDVCNTASSHTLTCNTQSYCVCFRSSTSTRKVMANMTEQATDKSTVVVMVETRDP